MIVPIACVLFCCAARSQTISGRVVSAGGEPVVGCVMIVQTVDSLYVAGGLTDAEGAFSIASDVRPFLLLAQHISCLPHATRYDDGDVGTILLADNPQSIDEIVVTGQRPLFTLDEGKISYDVSVLSARPSISLDVSGYYQSPAIQCTYDMEPSRGVDAGLKWTMAADKLTLSVNCTDIFSSTLPTVWAGDAARNFRMNSGRFNRGVDVRLSYRFGKFEEWERRKVDVSRLGH